MDERVLGVIPKLRKPKLLVAKTYTLVVSDRRLVFALLSAQMIKDAAAEAQRQAKAAGKGFFSRWGDQLRVVSTLHQKYLGMPIEVTLAENPDNLAVDHTSVTSVSLRERSGSAASDGSDSAASRVTTKFWIETSAGTHEFEADDFSQEWVTLLVAALGDRVHLEKGIFG